VTDHNHAAHDRLAAALNDAGDPDGAIAHYQQEFAIMPRHPQPLYNIGRILANQGKAAEAQAYYERALAIDPNYADAILNLAHARALQGHRVGAIALYRRGLQLQPDAARARFYLAGELRDQGDDAESRRELIRAREAALAQRDARLVEQIDAQLSRPRTTSAPASTRSVEIKPAALPIPTQSTENRPR
jgi:tetratricopeptide (TPR) repeat protein